MSDSRQRYLLDLHAEDHTLKLSKRDDPGWAVTLTFRQPEPDQLVLEGTMDGRAVQAKLRRLDKSQFLLVNRGFHWINEYPFNR